MSKPTFIKIPVSWSNDPDNKEFDMWINPEHISGIVEKYDGSSRFQISHASIYDTSIPFQEFLRYLNIAGCKFQTLGDLNLIGEPGEEGGVK